MATANIQVFGFKQLDKKLKGLGKKVERKVVSKALKETIKEVIQPEVVARVPERTGKLKAEQAKVQGIIAVAKGKEKPKGSVAWKIQTPSREKLGISADDEWYYPAIVEYKHKSFIRAGSFAARPKAGRRMAAKLAKGIVEQARKP